MVSSRPRTSESPYMPLRQASKAAWSPGAATGHSLATSAASAAAAARASRHSCSVGGATPALALPIRQSAAAAATAALMHFAIMRVSRLLAHDSSVAVDDDHLDVLRSLRVVGRVVHAVAAEVGSQIRER